jgi:hypothetical protein
LLNLIYVVSSEPLNLHVFHKSIFSSNLIED